MQESQFQLGIIYEFDGKMCMFVDERTVLWLESQHFETADVISREQYLFSFCLVTKDWNGKFSLREITSLKWFPELDDDDEDYWFWCEFEHHMEDKYSSLYGYREKY